MALVLRHGTYKSFWEGAARQEILVEARLNQLALEYGYKYRLDIKPRKGLGRSEFVSTLREARFVGMPIRRAGGTVEFSKILENGTLKRHQW
jgi:hypothetical protein